MRLFYALWGFVETLWDSVELCEALWSSVGLCGDSMERSEAP